MTGSERAMFLTRSVVWSPAPPIRAVFLAAVDQADDDIPAWGQGASGFGKRVANQWGRSAVRSGIESASAAALRYDQRYIHCNCDGLSRRALHALAMNFVTYNRNGKWVPHLPRVGGAVAAQYISLAWLPPNSQTAKEATRGLVSQLAFASVLNVWREFSPPLVRKLKSKLRR